MNLYPDTVTLTDLVSIYICIDHLKQKQGNPDYISIDLKIKTRPKNRQHQHISNRKKQKDI